MDMHIKTSLVRILGKQERRLLLVRDFKRTRKKYVTPRYTLWPEQAQHRMTKLDLKANANCPHALEI